MAGLWRLYVWDEGEWLTSDKNISADGSGAVNDGLDILIIAAVVACICALCPIQDQPFAVWPPRLPGALTDEDRPLLGGSGGS